LNRPYGGPQYKPRPADFQFAGIGTHFRFAGRSGPRRRLDGHSGASLAADSGRAAATTSPTGQFIGQLDYAECRTYAVLTLLIKEHILFPRNKEH